MFRFHIIKEMVLTALLFIEHEIGLNVHETIYQKRLVTFNNVSTVPIPWHCAADQWDKVDTLSDILSDIA